MAGKPRTPSLLERVKQSHPALPRTDGTQRHFEFHWQAVAQHNSHYKRCPKAERLCLRSDQSPSRPQYGRSPDKSRHALFKGPCQVRAALSLRNGIAPSGDAPEHGVITLPWAIAPAWASGPYSDSPGADLAGQSEQSDERRLKTKAKDSTVVTIGKHRSTNGGHGSPLPSLAVVEHFWWTRLPQSENFSRLDHILSEVWGCRRIDVDVDRLQGRTTRIGTGVAAFLRKSIRPSTAYSSKNTETPNPQLNIPTCPSESVR